MRTRSIAAAAAAATALGFTASLALPMPAQAVISSCKHGPTSGYVGWQAYQCSSNNPGADRYRAIARCIREDGTRRTAYGRWEKVIDTTSVATCPVNFSAYSGGYEKS